MNIIDTIAKLSHMAIIEVSGEDAEAFLHGQFTINVKTLPNDYWKFSAWCNPKGRVRTTLIIYRYENTFIILLPAKLKDKFIQQMSMYVLRAKVQLSDQSNTLDIKGISIKNNTLNELFNIYYNEMHRLNISHTAHILTLSHQYDLCHRYLLVSTPDNPKLQTLTKTLTPVDISTWQLSDIRAGYPWLSTQTTEQFLPQMLNLDQLNGLDYQKGCYPGQEIIARLHFLGKLKRRLHLAYCNSNTIPESGTAIHAKQQQVGTVINAQRTSDKQFHLLAVINSDALDNTLKLGNAELRLHQEH